MFTAHSAPRAPEVTLVQLSVRGFANFLHDVRLGIESVRDSFGRGAIDPP